MEEVGHTGNFVDFSWRLEDMNEMGDLVLVDSEESLKMEVEQGEEEEKRKRKRKEEGDSGVVRWEEYLPRMVIRVLLVEADDSTRQIIAALLRKCNYKVAAIPDGLKAWEILKRGHSNIDLVLTEVDLPSISGYALLTLIMEHDACKNIPVIMMSSSDSISMVFKCMLKGAADFLIKPVRRNELKNLWQHVWRRISANNGSGVQNLHGGHCKAEVTSKNRATRYCSDDDGSSSRKRSQSTEKASDAQSSCATRYLEAENAYVENMQGLSEMKPQGTSNLSNNELQQHDKGMRSGEETEEEKSTKIESSRVAYGNEAYASTSRLERVGSCAGRMAQDERTEPTSCRNKDNLPNGEFNEHARQVIDLIGTIDNHLECTQQQSTSNREVHNSSTTPQLELSLRRLNDPNDQRSDGKQKLNHSNSSAFSRYSSSKKLRSFLPLSGNSTSEAKGGDKFHEKLVTSQDASPQPVNALSSDEENKSTVMTDPSAHPEPAFPVPQPGLAPVSGVGFGGMCPGYGPMYPPVFNPQASQGDIVLKSTDQKESSPFFASNSLHSDPGTYCSSLGHSGVDETSNHEEKVAYVDQRKHANGAASQSANSTLSNNGVIAHLHSSAVSGSVCQGNENANQAVMVDNIEDEHVRDNGSNMLMNEQFGRAKGVHNSQREAALAKFRQKRKDRCYEKKVRYQSRKRLAEQRPRVKGQFVRQVQTDQPLVADADNRHEDDG